MIPIRNQTYASLFLFPLHETEAPRCFALRTVGEAAFVTRREGVVRPTLSKGNKNNEAYV